MNASADSGVSVSRIITPALAEVDVFCRLLTRAMMKPSPFSARYAYWKASAVPHTSLPAPLTANADETASNVVVPVKPTDPMSRANHPSGKAGGGGGGTGGVGVPGVTVTLSKVVSDVICVCLLDAARPPSTSGAITIVSLPTKTQFTPSVD